VPIAVSLGDLDGSETYILQITSIIPEGCVLYGASGTELSPSEGVYTLQPADVEEFAFLPPLHFSTPVQGQVVFETMATVTDSAADSTSQSTAYLTIVVNIEGVADKPNAKTILVTGNEDTPYDIGSALDTNGVLVDNDGSETLYMLIQGLPSGVFPTASAGEISYIGNNRWQVSVVGNQYTRKSNHVQTIFSLYLFSLRMLCRHLKFLRWKITRVKTPSLTSHSRLLPKK
jgi:hypothetical protein